MKQNILISSLGDDFQHLDTIIDSIKESLESHNKLILFCPSSIEYYDGQSEWELSFIEKLKSHSISFDEYVSLTSNESESLWQTKVQEASLIYLHGGNPIIQKQLYEDKGIYELLKHYEGLMLGASAGAMNMSRYITLTPTNEEYPDFVVKEALHRVDVSIYPHLSFPNVFYRFIMTGDGLVDVEDILTISFQTPLYLLADGQFIIDNQEVVPDPVIQVKDGIITRNSIPVYSGFDIIDERYLHQHQGHYYELLDTFDTMEQALEEGLILSLFGVSVNEERVYHNHMKFFASYEDIIVIKQVASENEQLFLIQHPHLKLGALSYLKQDNGTILESFEFKTIFSRRVEEKVVLGKIIEIR